MVPAVASTTTLAVLTAQTAAGDGQLQRAGNLQEPSAGASQVQSKRSHGAPNARTLLTVFAAPTAESVVGRSRPLTLTVGAEQPKNADAGIGGTEQKSEPLQGRDSIDAVCTFFFMDTLTKLTKNFIKLIFKRFLFTLTLTVYTQLYVRYIYYRINK